MFQNNTRREVGGGGGGNTNTIDAHMTLGLSIYILVHLQALWWYRVCWHGRWNTDYTGC